MLLCATNDYLLVVIFLVIWENNKILAWHNRTITPSPSFQPSSGNPSQIFAITPLATTSPIFAVKPSATSIAQSIPASSYCHYWQFACNNGQCVNKNNQCDGWWQCNDGSDEWKCRHSSKLFTVSLLSKTSRISAVKPLATTQGIAVSSYCRYWQFACNNGQCVNRNYQCDGWWQCHDGSDEWKCRYSSKLFTVSPSSTTQSTPVSNYCHYWQFACNNGQCVNGNHQCDGWWQCHDGSDEWNCRHSSQLLIVSPSSTTPVQSSSACGSWLFSCSSYGQCIPHYKVCDGTTNCYDGSDEWRCMTRDSTSKCQNKVDLGFILDSSGSVPFLDFQRMKSFVKDLASFFTISSDETRVSVMTFSSQVSIHIVFSRRFSDRYHFNNTVDSIGYSGGGTATGMALNVAYTDMFNGRNGARGAETKKVVIILTDGRSNNGMVSSPARQLKNAGVVIFAVGIGSYLDMHELHAMASEPTDQHVIRIDKFSQLTALAEQMSSRTCNASHFLVFCDNDVMKVVFERTNIPKHVNIDRLYLRDHKCRAIYNSTHVFVKTPLGGCGTHYEETEQTIFFSNTLSEDSSSGGSGGIITRDYIFKANFTCSYGRKRTVGAFSFEPAKQRIYVSLSGGGNLTFALDFYKSSSFLKPYTIYDYPVFKRLSDFIYIEYSVYTTNRDLVVHAETCRATPTNRAYDNPQYVFIANGCDNDTTIQHFSHGMNNVQRFSIQAFRFLSQHRFVYVHCDLVVCNKKYLNSTCARGNKCSRRYRRDVALMSSSDDSSRMYTLSFGPLVASKESNDEKSTGGSTSAANYSMIGSLVGVGCLAFVLAGALFYVIKRGKLRRVSSTPISQVLPMEKDEPSV